MYLFEFLLILFLSYILIKDVHLFYNVRNLSEKLLKNGEYFRRKINLNNLFLYQNLIWGSNFN